MALTLNTVSNLLERTQLQLDELKNIQQQVRENYGTLDTDLTGKSKIHAEIRDMKEEQEKYDTLFEEEESLLQAMGGKTRMQTLQEFILTYFYTGFVLLSFAFAFHYYIRSGFNKKEMFKVLGLMFFIGLVITGLLIRYA